MRVEVLNYARRKTTAELDADSCKRLIVPFILMEGRAASQSLNYKGRRQDSKLRVQATCRKSLGNPRLSAKLY